MVSTIQIKQKIEKLNKFYVHKTINVQTAETSKLVHENIT